MTDPNRIVSTSCDTAPWPSRGACRTPDGRKVIFSRNTALARAMCATCSVAGPCLMAALAEEVGAVMATDRFGVRGGLTGLQRHDLARGGAAGVEAFTRFARQRAQAAVEASAA